VRTAGVGRGAKSGAEQAFFDIDLHTQNRRTQRLALGVVFQRHSAAAAERVVQDEIERAEIRQFEAFDGTKTDTLEMPLSPHRR
jgi:hypothetical protein